MKLNYSHGRLKPEYTLQQDAISDTPLGDSYFYSTFEGLDTESKVSYNQNNGVMSYLQHNNGITSI